MATIDWYITKVRYNEEKTHIDSVIARKNNGDQPLGPEQTFSRQSVVEGIEVNKAVIYTAPPDGKGGLVLGARVEVIVIGRDKYLRTDKNNTPKDNLGYLPEF